MGSTWMAYCFVICLCSVSPFFALERELDFIHQYPIFQSATEEGSRIVGGQRAELGDAPYQISMRFKKYDFHFCGGSIINETWILTAAHCTTNFKPDQIEVVAGNLKLGAGGDRYAVDRIVAHERYDPNTLRNDIALLRLATPITYSDTVEPVELCDQYTEGGQPMMLSGWGLTSFPGNVSQELKKIDLRSITNIECNVRHFDKVTPPVSFFKQICTFTQEGEGACKGDSGGPLVDTSTGQLCGVVSWGVPCAKGIPDVYTRVYSYQGWIARNVRQNSQQK